MWSAEVIGELRRNLLKRLPLEYVQRRIDAMERHFPEAAVRGYESLIPVMTNHPGDRHVLAAAAHGGAAVLVTFNLADFPDASVAGLDVEVRHPDVFLLDQLDLYPGLVLDELRAWSESSARPPLSPRELVFALERAGVPAFADELLQRYLEQ